MIEYSPALSWTVTTQRDGSVDAWSVEPTESAGIGAAILVIADMFDNADYAIDLVRLGDEKWMILGASTLNGYPVPAEVTAYVLPTHRRDQT